MRRAKTLTLDLDKTEMILKCLRRDIAKVQLSRHSIAVKEQQPQEQPFYNKQTNVLT